MRTVAVVLLVSVICLAGGFFAGSAACHRSRVASAQAALRRASEAMTAGRRDEVLEYAFAAVDRDPQLYAAYELAADAVVRSGAMSSRLIFIEPHWPGSARAVWKRPAQGSPARRCKRRASGRRSRRSGIPNAWDGRRRTFSPDRRARSRRSSSSPRCDRRMRRPAPSAHARGRGYPR